MIAQNQGKDFLKSQKLDNNIDINSQIIKYTQNIEEQQCLKELSKNVCDDNINFIRLTQDFEINKHKIQRLDQNSSKKQKQKKYTSFYIQDPEIDELIQELSEEIYQMNSNKKIDITPKFDFNQTDLFYKSLEIDQNELPFTAEKQKNQGTYKMTTPQQKQLFLLKCISGITPEQAADQCGLAIKCAKRWIQNLSAERLKGGGRKIVDPILEQKLRFWICLNICVNSKIPSREQQMQYPMENSIDEKFKASKGWLEKYLDRNQLKQVLYEYRRNPEIKLIDIAKFFIVIPDNYAKNKKQLKPYIIETQKENIIYDKPQFNNENNKQSCIHPKDKPLMYSHMQYHNLDIKSFINIIERSNSYQRYLMKQEKQTPDSQPSQIQNKIISIEDTNMEIEEKLLQSDTNEIKTIDKLQDIKLNINIKRPLPVMLRQILKQRIIDEREERLNLKQKEFKQENLTIVYEIETSLFFQVAVNQMKLNPDQLTQIFNFQ